MKKVGVGIIGCGGIAQAVHLPNYMRLKDKVKIIAVADIREDVSNDVGMKFGAESYDNYHNLLSRDDIDAVTICTRTEDHASVTIDAAEAGKHILVEKPMATDLDDADKMIKAAEKAGVKLMVGHMKRWDQGFAASKRLISEGSIGKPFFFRATTKMPPGGADNISAPDVKRLDSSVWGGFVAGRKSSYVPQSVGPEAIMAERTSSKPEEKHPEIKGLGLMLAAGVYHADLIRWCSGEEFKEITNCTLWPINEHGIEGNAIAIGKMKSGAVAVLESFRSVGGKQPPGFEDSLEVIAPGGIIRSEGPLQGWDVVPARTIIYNENSPSGTYVPLPPSGRYSGEIKHFVECILEDKEPLTSGYEGRQAVEVSIAAYKCAREERPIQIPLKTSHM